jgi:2-haloacid dehalogenase
MSSSKQVFAFDIYGTICNTGTIAIALQSLLDVDENKATELSLLWRRYQLEYVA